MDTSPITSSETAEHENVRRLIERNRRALLAAVDSLGPDRPESLGIVGRGDDGHGHRRRGGGAWADASC